jgi:hypothetical protein
VVDNDDDDDDSSNSSGFVDNDNTPSEPWGVWEWIAFAAVMGIILGIIIFGMINERRQRWY